ncbi:MAG: M50 family metallopeptidase [Candidatus Borkfalkiaceae bacterium]|nr:M50 family metallopeptidase [Christensenellaceae bacterium]
MNFLLLASFGEVMSYIGYILLAVLVLLVMITVHELGHYIAGKIFGFGIQEFAIGFGPKIYKKEKKNGELFSVRMFPLGGFCSFKGEDEKGEDPEDFNNKKPWQRLIVLVSGAFMNYLLALLIIIFTFSVYGRACFKVAEVDASADYSSTYSLKADDVILKADGRNIYLVTDLMDALNNKNKGDLVDFLVLRDGEEQNVKIMLRENARFSSIEDSSLIITVLGTFKTNENGDKLGTLYSANVKTGFFKTIGRSFQYSFRLGGTVFTVLGQLISGKIGIGSVGGTVTTIVVTADAIKTGGFQYLLYISSLIGVNLAVFNLLPFPALDGARAVFCLIEWIFRKPVNRKVEAVIHAVGFVLLLLFAVFVDLQRCF